MKGSGRIVHLLPSFEVGGTETQLLRLLSEWEDCGIEHVVWAFGDGLLREAYQGAGLRPEALGVGVQGLVRLIRRVKQESPCLIHAHLYWTNQVARVLGGLTRTRVLSSDRCVDVFTSPLACLLDRQTFRWGSGTVVNSEAVRSFLVFRRGLSPEKIFVVPNGVPPHPSYPKQTRAGETRLLCTARLHEQKGVDILLKALAHRDLQSQTWRLRVAGDGPERESLRALASSLGLENRVTWLGEIREVADAYKDTDLFVLASRYEGLPNAVMEAMSFGLPVIVTDVGGAPDLVKHGQTGWLVPPEDPESLSRAIRLALAMDLSAVGREARCFMESRFSMAKSRLGLQRVYDNLLRGRG